ncbi:hypothetical protein DID75_04875 [Candidatus Marinamargulisbacteria bacterium SCGC AG-410-N11]|nr:hypothetical protein DID75_04875 [Candidatus Marinamargulisbacteria bacterium SCGC AG-410-N11]
MKIDHNSLNPPKQSSQSGRSKLFQTVQKLNKLDDVIKDLDITQSKNNSGLDHNRRWTSGG